MMKNMQACRGFVKYPSAGFLVAAGMLCAVGTEPAGGESASSTQLTAVKITQPQEMDLRRSTTQPGAIHAFHEAEVYGKVAGYLKELYVDIGDEVEAAQPLAEIDVPEMIKTQERMEAEVVRLQSEKLRFEAAIEVAQAKLQESQASVKEAEAQVAADRSEYGRVKELAASKAVTERSRDEALNRAAASQAALASRKANGTVAEAEVKAARASAASAAAAVGVATKKLEELEVLMSYGTLRAPFKGVITQRNVDPGDLVRDAQHSPQGGGAPLFRVSQMDRVRVRAYVPERDAVWVDVGDKAQFISSALRGKVFAGEVTRISKSLDPTTRTMLIEFDLPNPGHPLLPGMFGQVTILLEEHPGSLVLPAGSVRYNEDGSESHVYVVETGDKVRIVPVTTGLDDGHQIEIETGLAGTERVVTGMLGRLFTGQVVRILP